MILGNIIKHLITIENGHCHFSSSSAAVQTFSCHCGFVHRSVCQGRTFDICALSNQTEKHHHNHVKQHYLDGLSDMTPQPTWLDIPHDSGSKKSEIVKLRESPVEWSLAESLLLGKVKQCEYLMEVLVRLVCFSSKVKYMNILQYIIMIRFHIFLYPGGWFATWVGCPAASHNVLHRLVFQILHRSSFTAG